MIEALLMVVGALAIGFAIATLLRRYVKLNSMSDSMREAFKASSQSRAKQKRS